MSPLKCFLCTEVKDKVEVLVLNIRPSEHAELQTNKQWFSSVELWKQLQRWVMEVKYQRAACVSFNRSPTVNALLKWVSRRHEAMTEEQRTDGRIIQSERNPDDSCQTVRGRRTTHLLVLYFWYIFQMCHTFKLLLLTGNRKTADINISSAGHSVSVAFKEESGTKTWNTLNIQPVIVSLYKHDSSEIWNWVQLSNADVYLDVVASNKTGKNTRYSRHRHDWRRPSPHEEQLV